MFYRSFNSENTPRFVISNCFVHIQCIIDFVFRSRRFKTDEFTHWVNPDILDTYDHFTQSNVTPINFVLIQFYSRQQFLYITEMASIRSAVSASGVLAAVRPCWNFYWDRRSNDNRRCRRIGSDKRCTKTAIGCRIDRAGFRSGRSRSSGADSNGSMIRARVTGENPRYVP